MGSNSGGVTQSSSSGILVHILGSSLEYLNQRVEGLISPCWEALVETFNSRSEMWNFRNGQFQESNLFRDAEGGGVGGQDGVATAMRSHMSGEIDACERGFERFVGQSEFRRGQNTVVSVEAGP
jgi:hypothetical protein